MNGEIFLNDLPLKDSIKYYGLKSVFTTEIITKAIASANTVDEIAAGAYR
jgi:hypothetical protein